MKTTITGLLAAVIASLSDWGAANLLAEPPEGVFGVISASALILFSFVGFEDLVKMVEETN